MDKIELKSVIPNVFLNREDMASDIWKEDVTFEKGKSYLIEANSGTGKSSLCSYIYGYRKDYQGELLFDGDDTKRYNVGKWVDIRKRHISLLWQDLRLFPELTSMENIQIKNKLTGWHKKKKILEWFDMLGISDKTDEKIGKMSFGQQQRVALIRSLCQPFDFLLLDEPISHLDDSNSMIMGIIITEEIQRQGAGLISTSIGKHIEMNYNQVYKL